MACDRIERKIARSNNLKQGQRFFHCDRELVQYLLKAERAREALARRARFHLVEV